jgi:hypothetical protein
MVCPERQPTWPERAMVDIHAVSDCAFVSSTTMTPGVGGELGLGAHPDFDTRRGLQLSKPARKQTSDELVDSL